MGGAVEMEKIFKNLSLKKANLILLILASQDITAQVERQLSTQSYNGIQKFDILVPGEHAVEAGQSVNQYFRENKFFRLPRQLNSLEISSFNTPAAYVIMVLITAIHLLCLDPDIHREMILKFGASSLYLGQGETYRAITALFLHSDGQHLLGNLAGILIFAAPLISLCGYGTGPLLLLFAGTSGNLVNAYFHQNAILSIGASTAIMGAAGALAAYQMISRKKIFQFNRLIPLFAGATLVGLFSQGENTDVSAHVFGFMAGFFWSFLFFPFYRIVRPVLIPRSMEPAALVLLLSILTSAILQGL